MAYLNKVTVGGTTYDLRQVYPTGSIWLSTSSTSPASLFGGTWERIEDRFLLAAGNSYTAGSTGGTATHTLTTQEIPSHNHLFSSTISNTGTNWMAYRGAKAAGDTTLGTLSAGGGQAHNNMPPYLAVYAWRRIS